LRQNNNQGEKMGNFISTTGKQGIFIDEYQGKISLCAAYESNDGKSYRKWAKEQIRRDKYAEKATPVKVNLGNKDNVINVLREIAAAVGIEPQDVPF
jgi:hypothetical protein